MESGAFRDQGRRMTAQRRIILDLLASASGHIAPDDICRLAKEREPSINRSTVYRNLWALEEMGLVRHVHDGSGAERYHLNREPPHLHLYCHRCGHLAELGDVWLTEGLVETLRAEHGFHADPTHFPIAGTCRECAEQVGAP